jgi:hypothetical protein
VASRDQNKWPEWRQQSRMIPSRNGWPLAVTTTPLCSRKLPARASAQCTWRVLSFSASSWTSKSSAHWKQSPRLRMPRLTRKLLKSGGQLHHNRIGVVRRQRRHILLRVAPSSARTLGESAAIRSRKTCAAGRSFRAICAPNSPQKLVKTFKLTPADRQQ